MQIQLIAVGNKMPQWVMQGYEAYAKRLPRECKLILKEISAGKRGKKSNTDKVLKDEGKKILAAISTKTHIVTLDSLGTPWTTTALSLNLNYWLANGQNVALLVGGPEGLADAVKSQAHQSWSLSQLTFPHSLVRVLIAEQIYRAWSLLQNHPYHRGS